VLKGTVQALLDDDRPAEAIRLIEDGLDRSGHDQLVALQLNHLLAAAHFYAGEYTRAAHLFEAVGRGLPPAPAADRTARPGLRLPRRKQIGRLGAGTAGS
jgi:hypothetical protein